VLHLVEDRVDVAELAGRDGRVDQALRVEVENLDQPDRLTAAVSMF